MTYTCDRCGRPAQNADRVLAGSVELRFGGEPVRNDRDEPVFILRGDVCWHCRIDLEAWWFGHAPTREQA